MNRIIGRLAGMRYDKKITFKISAGDFVVSVICFCLSRAKILTYMNPFGMAAYASMFSNTGWFYALLCTASGIVLSKGDYTSVRYILALGIATPVLGLADKRGTVFKSLVMSLSYFGVSLCLLLAEGFLIYDFIYFSFEAFICLVSVFLIDDVLPAIVNYKSRTRLSVREITSMTCIAALVVLSCASLPPVFGLNLSSCIAVFIILAVNLRGDSMMGAAVGVVMGLVVSLGSYESASVVGAYAIASFLSGMFKKYSRLGVLLGFTLANAVVTAFLNDSGIVLIDPVEVLVAGLVFATMPYKFLKIFTDFTQKASGVYADSSCAAMVSGDSVVSALYRQCNHLAHSTSMLADCYAGDGKPCRPGKVYINRLFDKCINSVCTGCGLRFGCWNSITRNNYEYMLSMFEQANKNGRVDISHLPKKFADRCVKKEEFVRAFNLTYDIYQSDAQWLAKTRRLQNLMSGQLNAVATSLGKIRDSALLSCNMELSSELACALDKYNCEPCNVSVLEKNNIAQCVVVDFDADKYPEGYSKSVEKIISYTLDKSFEFRGEEYVGDDKKNMMFYPSKKYAVQSFCLQMQKNGEFVCGDCVEELTTYDGDYMLVLSDGMGSGRHAYNQARATVDMLCHLSNTGASVDEAIELVNSSLVVRSQKDCFATIDVLNINLDTGKINIAKTGAAPTYIQTGEDVKMFECSSLPAGILAGIRAQYYSVDSGDGAIVVVMSDGITNTTLKDIADDDWICNEIKNHNIRKPDSLARHILNTAIKKSGGKCTDDMTVCVVIVCKNE